MHVWCIYIYADDSRLIYFKVPLVRQCPLVCLVLRHRLLIDLCELSRASQQAEYKDEVALVLQCSINVISKRPETLSFPVQDIAV